MALENWPSCARVLAFLAGSAVESFSPQQQSSGIVSQQSAPASRRDIFQKTVASVAGVAGGIALSGSGFTLDYLAPCIRISGKIRAELKADSEPCQIKV